MPIGLYDIFLRNIVVVEICYIKFFLHRCSSWFHDHVINLFIFETSLLMIMFLLSIEKFSSTVIAMMRFEWRTTFGLEFIESHVKQLSFLLIIPSLLTIFRFFTAISKVLFNTFIQFFFFSMHCIFVPRLSESSGERPLAFAAYKEINYTPLQASCLAKWLPYTVTSLWLFLLLNSIDICKIK